VRSTPTIWIARLFVVVLSSAISAPVAAAATSSTTKPAVKKSTSTVRRVSSSSKARRARLARARAAARARYARELKEAQTPRFRKDASGEMVPDIRAEAAIIYNPVTGEVLWEENSQHKRSIASMTKVMTALVFLENNPDLSRQVEIDAADVRNASTTYLKARERIRLEDLMHLLLIASDNAAARALARVSPHGSEGFVDRMMEKAIELGLESTSFSDPSGLDANNVSSAYDMARLITYAVGNEHISSIMQKPSYQLTTSRHTITVHSTNKLLGGDLDVQGGKTGFIRQAGYCLATLLKLPQGQQVAVVVMGARNSMSRFWETRHLFQWLSEKTPGLVQASAVQ
jgi:D-alanyl-D-alanine endopeptidase (penicillin-binding protein 7)